MKKYITLVLFAMNAWAAQAQEAHRHTAYCGTAHGRHPWWEQYQRHRAAYNEMGKLRGGGITYLPVTMHIVCDDDGKGHASLNTVLDAFCQLNVDYSAADLQYFMEGDFDFIYNSAFNSHDTIVEGGTFALQYNVPNTFNPYFLADPAGYCGYSVRYADAVTVKYGCLGGHTLAHELGHDLLLEHPFYGWEGGISHDNTIPADFSQPAPQYIYVDYSMHNVYAGPSDVDTVEVENVDRTGPNANCNTAQDGFCDTDADYIAYRWQCNANGLSSETQIDPLGTVFQSDGQWIMSYSDDGCQTGFSGEQITAMRAYIFNERQSYLGNQNPVRDAITATQTLVTPASGATVSAYAREFIWNAVPGATHYVFEVTRVAGNYNSAQLMETVVTTDTSHVSSIYFAPQAPFLPYAWRVRPFNQGNTCAPVSAQNTFLSSTAISSNVEVGGGEWAAMVYPNPVGGGLSLVLECQSPQTSDADVRLFSVAGQTMSQQTVALNKGNNQVQVSTLGLAPGIYFLQLKTSFGALLEKVVVE